MLRKLLQTLRDTIVSPPPEPTNDESTDDNGTSEQQHINLPTNDNTVQPSNILNRQPHGKHNDNDKPLSTEVVNERTTKLIDQQSIKHPVTVSQGKGWCVIT